MSKFKKLSLDDLRVHGVNNVNPLLINSIDKFIEDTTLHLLQLDPEVNTDLSEALSDKHFDEGKYISNATYNHETIVLVEHSDMFVSFDFEVGGHYESDGEFDYATVTFTRIKLNWVSTQFDLMNTEVENHLRDLIIGMI